MPGANSYRVSSEKIIWVSTVWDNMSMHVGIGSFPELGALDACSTTGKPTRSFATERVSLDSV